jgi:pteridine reductase
MASRRALVTGGAIRVGRTISVALGRAGYDVAIHYSSSDSAAAEVGEEIRDLGRRASIVHADLLEPEAPDRLLAEAAERLGGLDLLINNAAAFPHARPEDVTTTDWDALFSLNTRAPFFCSVAAARTMGDDGGSIINITDSGVGDAWPGYAPYLASKAALVSLTRSLARAWAPKIRVNAVAPGPVLLPEGSSASERATAAARTALGRVGRAEDVAEAVLYLDNAEYVTGEVLFVDGGSRLL